MEQAQVNAGGGADPVAEGMTSEPTPAGARPDLVVGDDGRARCAWGASDADYRAYHDDEWGRPLRDERALFELLCLEAFQSGLSWALILRKRPGFRVAFDGFDPERVAAYGDADVARLLGDDRIVRNRAKVDATIANARAVVALHEADETLVDTVWSHAPGAFDGSRRANRFQTMAEVPSETSESKAMAKDLRRRGFRFVGPVVGYALMQSAGLVDDHLQGCWVTR